MSTDDTVSLKPPGSRWWRFFTLREQRVLYEGKVTLQTPAGDTITVRAEGRDPAVVARFINKLRQQHKEKP
jgi:hypothetical protein